MVMLECSQRKEGGLTNFRCKNDCAVLLHLSKRDLNAVILVDGSTNDVYKNNNNNNNQHVIDSKSDELSGRKLICYKIKRKLICYA